MARHYDNLSMHATQNFGTAPATLNPIHFHKPRRGLHLSQTALASSNNVDILGYPSNEPLHFSSVDQVANEGDYRGAVRQLQRYEFSSGARHRHYSCGRGSNTMHDRHEAPANSATIWLPSASRSPLSDPESWWREPGGCALDSAIFPSPPGR